MPIYHSTCGLHISKPKSNIVINFMLPWQKSIKPSMIYLKIVFKANSLMTDNVAFFFKWAPPPLHPFLFFFFFFPLLFFFFFFFFFFSFFFFFVGKIISKFQNCRSNLQISPAHTRCRNMRPSIRRCTVITCSIDGWNVRPLPASGAHQK